ncbi:cytochrome c biogenesis CcdA family protein [Anaerobranca gottschalkii]|uniref:Cytochrome c-type biogenesis protein n=1 Tax=Anaerobranca gottschalkii DSM 13577 TaxID=1120990 RepID=A0A1H9YUY1_9FIRM|nr:cytochrome c biogenesis protein CcdA [Anaerobranca gottschalkii]SES72896.1 cytochrome c-type biogenesis protein [Anaerobranca gottschalkii DSM 13577]
MDITLGIAFWGGMVSVLSPCVFPLIPSFYAQLVAFNHKGKGVNLILNTIVFVLGFSLVFIFLGVNASIIGRVLFNYLSIIRRIGGFFIVLFGLSMLGVIQLNLFATTKKRKQDVGGMLGSFLFGIFLGTGWLPCVGPVLASILILSTNVNTVLDGAILLSAYSLGFAIPIVVSMIFMGKILKIKTINKYLPYLHKLSGFILILVGILLFFDYLSVISLWLVGRF